MPKQPLGEFPELPVKVSALPDDELIDLMSSLASWANFLGALLAEAEVDERISAEQLEYQEARSAIRQWDESGGKVTLNRLKKVADPDLRDRRDAALESYRARKYLATALASADRSSQVLSRELTRRVSRTR